MRRSIAALGAVLIVGATAARAQNLRIVRQEVLATVGTVLDEAIEIQPAVPGPGRVFRQQISKPTTSWLRFHFTVAQQPADASWHVEIVPAGNAPRQQYRPAAGESDFWTKQIPGSTATIEVFTTAANVPLKLTIDRVAVSKIQVQPKSISRDGNQLEPYRGQPEPVRTLGRSVVRLRFIDDAQKKVFTCTGFLVFTSAHILTNEHCINSDAEMRSALVDFDFDDKGGAGTRTVTLSKLLLADEALDFSLLQLAEPADRAALTFASADPADKRELLVIQHPAGEVKQISRKGCHVNGAQVAGVSEPTSDFGHECDTLGGSSGSPVMDSTDVVVVGLHHFGFFPGDPKPVNQAVRISLILDTIKKRFPSLTASPTQ